MLDASSELRTRESSSVELRRLQERLEKASRSENGASRASLSDRGERRGVLALDRQSEDRQSSSAASRMDSRTCTRKAGYVRLELQHNTFVSLFRHAGPYHLRHC